ncbi:tetratricopeptide repeat protein [bacterium]|nr:tetratricopeptide repeat protein [bacterium]
MNTQKTKKTMFETMVLLACVILYALVMFCFSIEAYQPVIMKHLVFYIGVIVIGLSVLLCPANRGRLTGLSFRHLPFLLYFALLLISFLYSDYPRLSIGTMYSMLALLLFFVSLLSLEISEKNLRIFLSLIYIVSFITGIYGFIQFWGYDPISWQGFQGRVFSTFGHPDFYASFLIFTIPIIVLSILSFQRPGPKIIGVIILAISCSNVLFARSRSAWIGLIIALVPLFFLRRVRMYFQKSRMALLVLVIMFMVFALWIIQHREIGARIVSALDLHDPSIQSRLVIYKNLFPGVMTDPFWGKGIGTFSAVFPQYQTAELYLIPPFTTMTMLHHAHSEYIEILLESGLIGFLLFLACMGVALFSFRHIYRDDTPGNLSITLGIMLGLFALLVQALTSVSLRFLSTQIIFWSGLAIVLSRSVSLQPARHLLFPTKRWQFSFIIVFTLLLICMAVMVVPFTLKTYQADELLAKSQKHDLRGDTQQSVILLQRALKKNPYSLDILHSLGFALIKQQKYDEALSMFEQVLTVNPHYPLTHYYLGLVKYIQGDLVKARIYLDEARTWRPNSWQIEDLYGQILLRENKLDQAEQNFLREIEIAPDQVTAYLNLGDVALQNKDYNQAFYYFAKALRLDPDQIDVWRFIEQANQQKLQKNKRLKIEYFDPDGFSQLPPPETGYCPEQWQFDSLSPSLQSIQSISQDFEAICDTISSFSFQVATRMKTVTLVLHLKLYEIVDDHVVLLHSTKQTYEHIKDADWLTYQFDPIERAGQRRFRVVLKAVPPHAREPVYLWLKVKDIYARGQIGINELYVGSDLRFRVK